MKERILIMYALLVAYIKAAFKKQRIFLMSTPYHGNLGDQAIILAEQQLLKKIYPEYTLIEYPTEVLFRLMRWPFLKPCMKKEDIIALPGGGNLGSLYPSEEIVHRWIISNYSNQKIFFMPQSIFFSSDKEGKKQLLLSQRVYNDAKNLTIFERDLVSYELGKKNFPNVAHRLAPDTVTTLNCEAVINSNVKRNGVCLFLRSDKEKKVDDSIIIEIKKKMNYHGIKCVSSDTVIDEFLYNNTVRWNAVKEKMMMARQSRLVITDRFHGTIFSVITHTPVIVFKSYDTKISAGIRWFKDLPWVHYAENMDVSAIEMLIKQYCCGDEIKVTKTSSCGKILENSLREWRQERM